MLLLNKTTLLSLCIKKKKFMISIRILLSVSTKITHFFTDTCNTLVEIFTKALYRDSQRYKKCFDLSQYPQDSKFLKEAYEKHLGNFEDETTGYVIADFSLQF